MTLALNFDCDTHRTSKPRKAQASPAKGSRIEEFAAKVAELYALAGKLGDTQEAAQRTDIRFTNNPKAAHLNTRLETAISGIFEEAARLEETMTLEEIATPREALLLLLTTSWRLDCASDENLDVIENTWKAIIAFLERDAGTTAAELGYGPLAARRQDRKAIINDLARFERTAGSTGETTQSLEANHE
jgi:hypothetical protein